jgi:hypothetical protein
VRAPDDYFKLKKDANGKLDFSSHHNCTDAVWMLANGVACDLVDECMSMSESTGHESMYKFPATLVKVFGKKYLK